MKFRDLTIIFVCILFYIFEISPVMGQAGIRAQGRDVNTPGTAGQQFQGQNPNLLASHEYKNPDAPQTEPVKP